MKKNVLHINKAFSIIGGVEKYIRDVASYDYENVDKIDVLAISDNSKSRIISIKNGQAIECGRLFSLASAPFSFSFIYRFIALSFKYDVLHFHYPNPIGEMMLVLMRPFLWKKSIIVTYHNDVSSEKPFSSAYNLFAKLFFSLVHKILVTSPNLGKSAKVIKGFQDKIEVIPLGIKIINGHQKMTKNNIRSNEKDQLELLFVGRLASVKGIDYLIKAVSDLNVRLTIVGVGDKSDYLKNLAKSINSNNVYFSGELSEKDLTKEYQNADLFILPSVTRGEGFGYVVLEAMNHGCAIITTELGTGTSYVNLSEYSGLVVAPANESELRNAINRFDNDRGFLNSCRHNAAVRVKEFTIEKLINRLDQVYKAD